MKPEKDNSKFSISKDRLQEILKIRQFEKIDHEIAIMAKGYYDLKRALKRYHPELDSNQLFELAREVYHAVNQNIAYGKEIGFIEEVGEGEYELTRYGFLKVQELKNNIKLRLK